MSKKQIFLFLAWIFLFSFPVSAQIDEVLSPEEQQRLEASEWFVKQRIVQSIFEKDISPNVLVMLSGSRTDSDSHFGIRNSIREELGITGEHAERLEELLVSGTQGPLQEFIKFTGKFDNDFKSRALNGDIYLTEEEEKQFDKYIGDVHDVMESAVAEVFTEEQREKVDGMILALTGGLESPFFNERSMTTLEMTDEQKRKFAAINEELKPERDKMVGEFINKIRNSSDGGVSFQDFLDGLSAFKDYGREIKKRRSEILTSKQIAKVMKLSKLPKALSLFNLLPQWVPNADSWKPGDPLPEGLVPNNPQPAPRFPIGEQY